MFLIGLRQLYNVPVHIYAFVYTPISAYFLRNVSLSVPSVPQLQKLYLCVEPYAGRVRFFHIVTVQKVKNILKIVATVIE